MLEEDSSELVAGSSGLKNADYELSATSQEQIPGGIDLNPQLLELTTGGAGEIDIPFDPAMMPNTPIEGFAPIIINITPVTNFPLLLGLSDVEQEPQLSMR